MNTIQSIMRLFYPVDPLFSETLAHMQRWWTMSHAGACGNVLSSRGWEQGRSAVHLASAPAGDVRDGLAGAAHRRHRMTIQEQPHTA